MANMFDLSEELSLDIDKKKTATPKSVAPKQSGGATLFFSDNECKEAVIEAYVFEGLEEPKCFKGTPQPEKDQALGDVVLVQLTSSVDIEADAQEINATLPNNKTVILLGQTDSIHVLRRLEKLGFYYLPWPVDRAELIECLKQASLDERKRYESGYFRKAKRVAVVGTKGGIGTSVIATELSVLLAKKGSRTILVDHHYTQSNIDIILSQKDLEQVDVSSITVEPSKLDEESATSYLNEVEHNFFYLGFTGKDKIEELEKYTNIISEKLARQANFMISDFSGSLDFPLNPQKLMFENDVVVLVTEPSVSGVRATQRLLDKIKDIAIPQLVRPRVMVVVNHHRPEGSFNLNLEEVERFLKVKADVIIPFYKTASKQLIDGKKLHQLEKGKQTPFTQLSMAINGQNPNKKSGLFAKFSLKRGKK
ncbi:AAA family ATPase [Vibrio neonatus]|uniref:AAA family ATPase n=1 Tax=Vibrio neonatus TaxID=278860 RepID=UPI0021C25EB6|nr:P-loop NTPase [Vibrio neonatus]